MPASGSKLDRPACAVVTRILRRHFRDADVAWERLRGGGDDEALHDFRVAVRKIRSTLRAYRPQLDGVLRAKDRRRLKRLANATNEARDAEVQIARLRALRDGLGPGEQAVVTLLLRRLRRTKREAYALAGAEIEARFPRTARALGRRLRRADESSSLPFRFVIAPLLATLAGDLRPLLAHAPLEETGALHQARIEVKRARYLLEPVRRAVPGSVTLLRRLQRLQDVLGDVNDLEKLEQTIRAVRAVPAARGGTVVLLRLVREQQRQLRAELGRAWFGEHAAAGLLDPLDALAERLGARRHPARAIQPGAVRSRAVGR
jgi:CHAD domain-containing protein